MLERLLSAQRAVEEGKAPSKAVEEDLQVSHNALLERLYGSVSGPAGPAGAPAAEADPMDGEDTSGLFGPAGE